MKYTEKYKAGMAKLTPGRLVTNKALLEMCEDAAGFQSDLLKQGVNEIENRGSAWIIMAWHLKMVRRPAYGEDITVTTWSRNMSKVYAVREFELTNDEGQVLCRVWSKWVLMDNETRHIIRIPRELDELYDSEPVSNFDKEPDVRIHEPEEYDSEISYTVMRRDADLIGHMHNTNYLDLVYQALPEAVYKEREFSTLTLTFKNEIKPGESVKCGYKKTDEGHKVIIYNENGICAACVLA